MPVALCLLSVLLTQPRDYTLDELVFLNGIGGFGDVGLLDTSRTFVSPRSALGFSLKVEWEDRPGGPSWWSIRMPIPGCVGDYDTFSFDLLVEDVEGAPSLNVFLYETDDDRWICWTKPLASVPRKRWLHYEVPRQKMRMWLIGDHKPQWERVHGLAIEPSTGKAVFYIDAPRLAGPAGTLDIFTVSDDGLRPDSAWKEPIQIPAQDGYCYFPFDEARLDRQDLLETPVQLAALLGRVGVPISGYSRSSPRKVKSYWSRGVPAVHYSALAAGYNRFITRRQGWDVRFDGVTPNKLPLSRLRLTYHAICHSHPAVLEALSLKAQALAKAGFGAWMVVDYVMPYWGGLWGYGPASIAAYRRDLAGADDGLRLSGPAGVRAVHFPEYFRMYNGFYPSPAELGLESWAQFTPPRPQPPSAGERAKRRMQMFQWLRTYEWLKLADTVGRRMQSLGGDGLWIIPNPEDTYGSPDYVALVRCQGVGNLFPEWFGPIGWAAEGCYASLPYLRRQAQLGGTRLSIIQETGAGGHSDPYLDWRIAYAGVYALTAEGSLQDFDNDFIDHVPFAQMSSPDANMREFIRFRDAVAKAMAFQQARRDKARRPTASILCIASRPPCFKGPSFFFGLSAPYTLAVGLSRARLLFDLRDSFDLRPGDLDPYRCIVYCPRAPRVGDMEMLGRWVRSSGRVLVTHSFVPTRRASGFWRLDSSATLGDPAGGGVIGLGRITYTDRRSFRITSVATPWRGLFPKGETIQLPHPLVSCEGMQTLIGTDAGPLVSSASLGKGRVIFLHYVPGVSTDVHRIDTRVMQGLARMLGLRPYAAADFGLLLQRFQVPGGCVVIAWDGGTMGKWHWEYRPGIEPMAYNAEAVDEVIDVPVSWDGPATVYDFFEDTLHEATNEQGRVRLRLRGRLCGMYYVVDRSSRARATLESARGLRRKMKQLRFDDVGMRAQ